MKEENRLIDAIIDLGVGMKYLREEMKGMRKDMNHHQQETNQRLEKLEKQQQKTNLAIGELRLTNMKLDESFKKLDGSFNRYAASNDLMMNQHQKRILRLEDAILPESGKTYMLKEPETKYDKKKKSK